MTRCPKCMLDAASDGHAYVGTKLVCPSPIFEGEPMNLNGSERKYTLPDWMLEVVAKEADRLLIPPANMLVILLDEIIRIRGLKK